MIGLILFLAIYFIPSIVSASRGHKNNGTIIVVNVFFGWTFIGWVVALAMACSGNVKNS